MKYRCLILDHDDTVVNSTATVHYPAFLAYMKDVRPSLSISLEEYFAYNFDPGVIPFFRDICGLDEKEMQEEEAFWYAYVKDRIPPAFPGMKELLRKYKEMGGRICVVSHSFSSYIRRDYAANGLPDPDLIFGWELPSEKRKPSVYAIREIEKAFSLSPDELLVVDDLKPGHDMAAAAGVAFAAAGWAYRIPSIEAFMRKNCDFYLPDLASLEALITE